MYTLAWLAASFVGPLAGGLALDHLGRTALWSGCALAGTAVGLGYHLLLRPRRAPAPAAAEPAPTIRRRPAC